MDWQPVTSVQQKTPDNDFCHFSISNVGLRYAFWALFKIPENSGLTPGQNDDPVTRTWKTTQMTHWPGDPMTQFHVWCIQPTRCRRWAAAAAITTGRTDTQYKQCGADRQTDTKPMLQARNFRRILVRGVSAPLPPEAKKILKIWLRSGAFWSIFE